MADYETSIEGMQDVQAEIAKMVDKKPVTAVVKRNLAEMSQVSQRLVPVDTGNLKRSKKETMVSGLTGELSYTAGYAAYLEYGTRFQRAQPYARPAAERQEPKFKRDLEELFKL